MRQQHAQVEGAQEQPLAVCRAEGGRARVALQASLSTELRCELYLLLERGLKACKHRQKAITQIKYPPWD